MNALVNFNYLRPKKAAVLKTWHEKDFYNKTNISAESFSNAIILPLKRFEGDSLLFGRGGVVDESGNYIDKSAINRRVQYAYEFGKPTIKDKKVVYCGYLINHWGHFLVEAVSRMWYFLKKDDTIDSYVFFVNSEENRTLKGNYREFFELLGVLDKIEIINTPTQYREVVVPELGYKWREYYSDEHKQIFDTIAQNIRIKPEWKRYDKIYLTRSQLAKAAELEFGLDMLDDFFSKNGYKVISPEKISLSEMIYYIRNAEICASISGSLPHNMLFANDNQKLTIVERNIYNNEIQVDVNNIKSLNATYIDANIAIYPINLGYGPFIMSYKGLLEKYAEDNKLNPPDSKHYSQKCLKKHFQSYMREYRKAYHYQWFMEEWSLRYIDYIREAYLDSLNYYGDYLSGNKPYKFSQNFSIHFIKKNIKRLLGR